MKILIILFLMKTELICQNENVDWCIEKGLKYDRYRGTIYDVCLMSKGDFYIGGKSNILMYLMNYNPNLEFIIPKYLLVDVY